MDSGSFFPRNVQAAQSRQLIHLGRLRRANESALAQSAARGQGRTGQARKSECEMEMEGGRGGGEGCLDRGGGWASSLRVLGM